MGCQNCILRVQWHFLWNFFSKNHINWHCERKNSAGFVPTAFYFSGELLSKTILEVVLLDFFLVPARFFKHGLPKLYSTCPEALFAELFSQNHNNWHCERKKSAGFDRFAFFFPGNFWAKNSRFLVLARFFKHGLPKLYSTCPVALSAEFFSKNHINWHCERKNSAGFVQTAFYFSGELLSKTILVYYSLPDSSSMGCQNCIPRVQRHFLRNFFHRIILIGTVSEKIQLVLSELHSTFPRNFRAKQFSFTIPCQILQAWVAKLVFYVSRGNFCGILFTESY